MGYEINCDFYEYNTETYTFSNKIVTGNPNDLFAFKKAVTEYFVGDNFVSLDGSSDNKLYCQVTTKTNDSQHLYIGDKLAFKHIYFLEVNNIAT